MRHETEAVDQLDHQKLRFGLSDASSKNKI